MVKFHSKTLSFRLAVILFGLTLYPLAGATPALAAEYYASPNGSSRNSGSIDSPLDLETALGAASPARAGDTIWLRNGRYIGNFVSYLTGTPSAPIIVRQYPGERATIDADTSQRTTPALTVRGSDTWYWGFEVTDSNPVRMVTGGYNPPRATSVWILAPRTKFINMIVHDGEQGFGFWDVAANSELYGNLIYNQGFESDDRGHGHAIYVQNTSGTKKIVDNILANGYSFGIHAYSQNGRIDNIQMIGNTIFNQGALSRTGGAKANLYMGGADPEFPLIQENYLYYSPFDSGGRNLDLKPSCINGRIINNYAAGGTAMAIYCVGTTVTGNLFAGRTFTDTSYPDNTVQSTEPTGVAVFVRANQYEPGARANVTIYNWDRRSSVQVDLSRSGFARGTPFELRDAQNYFGRPVVTGTYDGTSITVPMTGLTVVPPVGNIPIVPSHTAPQFGAFILVRAGGSAEPPAPTASFTASPPSINAGQSTLLTWSTTNATQVTIDNGLGTVPTSGSASVSPSSTTTYVLTAGNDASTVSRSATVTVVPPNTPPPGPPPGAGSSATFVKTDTTTLGSWKGVYGNAGYSLNAIGTQPAPWSQVGMSGDSSWVWDANAIDSRALERPSGGRIAATWYSDSAFNIDISVTDGQQRYVTFYMIDWDAIGRTQNVEVTDAATGGVLDRRTVSDFRQGGYWVWQISGAVRFRFAKVAGQNAVVSGIFFDNSGPTGTSNSPPRVALSLSGAQVAPATLALSADASDTDGTVSSVRFYSGTTLLSTDTSAPYSYNWSGVQAGTYQLTAVATDNQNATTTSSTVTATVTPPSGGGSSPATATFAGLDLATGGTWSNLFPIDDGHAIAQAIDAAPPYAKVTMQGQSSWMWDANPADSRALETTAGRRVASTWYSDSGFSIDVAITDGQAHRVALYALDWDAIGRSQTIEVLDAVTGTRLDARTVANFGGGQYLQWNITGTVRFRMTRVTGRNAVISGIFFGPTGAKNPPPTVTVSTTGTLAAPASLTLTAAAADGDGIREVRFYSGTTLLSTDTTSPYEYAWSNVSAGTYRLTAAATDNLGATTTSAPVSLTVRSGTGGGATGATFAGIDGATKGSWKGAYGAEGHSLAMETNAAPSFAQLALTGHSSWTWQPVTTDPRALERAGVGRMAATWYSDTTFTIDLSLTDGNSHVVALYLLDWDDIGRSQQIDILDPVTNAVLDTRTVSNFTQGQYWVWQISGRVRIRVSRLTGRNAVVGGVFFGAP